MSYVYLAPMVGWTTTLFRQMIQVFHPDARVFTEMLTVQSLVYGRQFAKLRTSDKDRDVIVQLAGSEPSQFSACEEFSDLFHGFDEINLNVGCPSSKVQNAKMGACLMYEPERVAECLKALKILGKPVSVKCRIGVDNQTQDDLFRFIEACMTHTNKFYVHARYAWLNGINPKQNRSIPPIQYDVAEILAERYPMNTFIINGELQDYVQTKKFLSDKRFGGVMIGRAAYQNPWLFYQLSTKDGFNDRAAEFLDDLLECTARELDWFKAFTTLTRGISGGKKLRQYLAENKMADLSHLRGDILAKLSLKAKTYQTCMEEAPKEYV